MKASEAMRLLEGYDLLLVMFGLVILTASVLPRLFAYKPVSLPLVLLGLGFLVFALPLGLAPPDPLEQGPITERITELGVIIALMGAGLKLDRPPEWRRWSSTWLLGTTIAAATVLGW